MSENDNHESESIAVARRRRRGKPEIIGLGEQQRREAHQLGHEGRPKNGAQRFNDRFSGYVRKH